MKNWKKGMIAGSIICIAAGFLFIGIGSSMGGWKNIDQINSRYIHFGGSDTFIGLNLPENTKESIEILSRETDRSSGCRKRQHRRGNFVQRKITGKDGDFRKYPGIKNCSRRVRCDYPQRKQPG